MKNKGFTIVEVLVATAMAGVLIVGIMGIMKLANKRQRALEERVNENILIPALKKYISSSSCKIKFISNNKKCLGFPDGLNLNGWEKCFPRDVELTLNRGIVKSNSKVENVRIESFRIKNPIMTSKNLEDCKHIKYLGCQMNLELEVRRHSKVKKIYRIPVMMRMDSASSRNIFIKECRYRVGGGVVLSIDAKIHRICAHLCSDITPVNVKNMHLSGSCINTCVDYNKSLKAGKSLVFDYSGFVSSMNYLNNTKFKVPNSSSSKKKPIINPFSKF